MPSRTLDVVPNPHPDRDYEVSMTVPEFTCLCPMTGQPDFATIRIRYVPDRKGHDQRYSLDETKISEELGYAPTVDFDRGLADTVAWYRDNAHWWKASKHRSNEPPVGEGAERTPTHRSGEGAR